MKKSNVQSRIAVASFVAAIAFSIAGFIVPPLGDLTEANLYLVAQFLLVTTSLFGVSAIVSKSIISKFNKEEDDGDDEKLGRFSDGNRLRLNYSQITQKL